MECQIHSGHLGTIAFLSGTLTQGYSIFKWVTLRSHFSRLGAWPLPPLWIVLGVDHASGPRSSPARGTRQGTALTHPSYLWAIWQLKFTLACVLDGGRKPENVEETHRLGGHANSTNLEPWQTHEPGLQNCKASGLLISLIIALIIKGPKQLIVFV